MKNLRISTILLLLLALPCVALAQTDDWEVLKQIPQGTKLHVDLKRGRNFGHCRLSQVTDEELVCYTQVAPSVLVPPFPPRQNAYRRANVRAVSLPHNGVLIGFGVGAGAGAVLGAARDPTPGLGRGGTSVLSALLLGGVGAFVGMVADPFFHGKTIYRSPAHP
jgi:hypothetical protein